MSFKDCICFRLGKTARKVTRAYREEIATYGLTHGQFFLIIAIIEQEGLLPSELAEKTFQDRPTITGLLDRLEKDSWIERRPDPSDRRSLRIYLGARGNDKKTAVLKLFENTNQKFLDRFSKTEWKQMQSFLVRLEQ
ncbi:MarR family transcriptional regulator [Desulfosarcina alkanivorans]|jgi:DNA-binding MarR family transcriptional regulator|uniref:MarR family transcriptional regulator n=1 Tax=Desulfosarcina alkanivorans TaxID=571177 RepID=A0A5K7YPQ2_9BACT|nr:MarR family transcriptional regulator [Desulfosarcina alkanivorans]BBO69849.1 MarR family transcriptional regulator [Desulfosarcina alkanivorans]